MANPLSYFSFQPVLHSILEALVSKSVELVVHQEQNLQFKINHDIVNTYSILYLKIRVQNELL